MERGDFAQIGVCSITLIKEIPVKTYQSFFESQYTLHGKVRVTGFVDAPEDIQHIKVLKKASQWFICDKSIGDTHTNLQSEVKKMS